MNLDKLEKLSSLKEKGIITQEEFDNQKKIILGQSNVFKSNKAILDFSKHRDIWNNYLKCFKKYFQFSGRATRYEFWGFTLINVLVSLVLSMVDALMQTEGILGALFCLVTFIPSISVSVRRLHDVNKSAWNLFFPYLFLIPIAILGAIIDYSFGEIEQISKAKSILYIILPMMWYVYILYLTCKKSDGDNKYGHKYVEDEKAFSK